MNIYEIKQQSSKSNTSPEEMLLFLDNEKKNNEKENWNKLGKTKKLALLSDYADSYGINHQYSTEKIVELKEYLKFSLNVTKLLKLKDISL